MKGFTLLELLVVVAMLGILGSLVSLQVAPLLSRTRLDRGARQVAADLQLVRMKAIAQNRRFRITFRPSTRDYIVDKDEGGTWQRQVLHGHESGPTDSALIALNSVSDSTTSAKSNADPELNSLALSMARCFQFFSVTPPFSRWPSSFGISDFATNCRIPRVLILSRGTNNPLPLSSKRAKW